MTFTPPTPAADPSAIFELGDAEQEDAVELPATIGEEEVLEAGVGEIEVEKKSGTPRSKRVGGTESSSRS